MFYAVGSLLFTIAALAALTVIIADMRHYGHQARRALRSLSLDGIYPSTRSAPTRFGPTKATPVQATPVPAAAQSGLNVRPHHPAARPARALTA